MVDDLELRETVATKLARIEERLENLTETNNSKHNEILDSVKNLCSHVNHENDLMDTRIISLETTRTENIAQKKGALTVWKVSTAILALSTAILTIAKIFGLI